MYSYLALDVHAKCIGELEGVKEGVGNDSGPVVGSLRLQEPADHLGPEHTAELVAELYRVATAVGGDARLNPHVELACSLREKKNKKKKS